MSGEKIYVASSWRTMMQQAVVCTLQAAHFDVYDFRNPPGGTGFKWKSVGLPNTTGIKHMDECSIQQYIDGLNHPTAVAGFESDMKHLENADMIVLVLPCGSSAHLELGWAVGAGKKTCIYAPEEMIVPELMYKMVDHISPSMYDLLGWCGVKD